MSPDIELPIRNRRLNKHWVSPLLQIDSKGSPKKLGYLREGWDSALHWFDLNGNEIKDVLNWKYH
ncbi:hypothetical protein [Phaeocystidibacter marisrubri]|uniref:Uncharacterized protein n=1 Tax=Phaeocystidibacter marisrubri TaxID=1577780 RepID=A0A6L3ZCU0_9FLAO|nr:hypothetical protein [Phaeocystidibacter marisrubri]KAB2815013.1 hypothetical protein F8C82_14620 [Phaeocystidibacter marisrubri]GGH78045.1 hypothetical protein GCM10011318_28730 [Phaeocystidibacter marisrubri]